MQPKAWNSRLDISDARTNPVNSWWSQWCTGRAWHRWSYWSQVWDQWHNLRQEEVDFLIRTEKGWLRAWRDTSTKYVSRSVAPENNLREDDQTGSHLLPDCHQSTPKGIICTGLGSCNPTPCARLREPLMWPSLLNLGGSWFRVRWLLESRWSQFNYAGTLILKVKVLKNVCYGT